jgi:hypothetical protein
MIAGVRNQILAAVVLAGVTYGSVLRIAEARNETAVGGGAFPLDDQRHGEFAAFQRLRTSLADIGDRREVFDWALESAVLTARSASGKAARAPRAN